MIELVWDNPLVAKHVRTRLRRGQIVPWVPGQPTRMTVEFNRTEQTDYVAKLMDVERLDAYTVSAVHDSYEKAHRAVWSMVGMSFSGTTAHD